MKKCTLCVDRIYNETLPEEDREPACVRTCPTGARHFGDFADPDRRCRGWWPRGGYDLMPDMGTKPTNKYLPPRKKDRLQASPLAPLLDIRPPASPAGWTGCWRRSDASRTFGDPVFTVLSGLGFGFLAFLGWGALLPAGWAAFSSGVSAMPWRWAGLLASTFHLGNPQNACGR
jgi:hypothetical protein